MASKNLRKHRQVSRALLKNSSSPMSKVTRMSLKLVKLEIILPQKFSLTWRSSSNRSLLPFLPRRTQTKGPLSTSASTRCSVPWMPRSVQSWRKSKSRMTKLRGSCSRLTKKPFKGTPTTFSNSSRQIQEGSGPKKYLRMPNWSTTVLWPNRRNSLERFTHSSKRWILMTTPTKVKNKLETES